MENRFDCLICNKNISIKNCSVSRHMKTHNLSIEEYISDKYKLVKGNYEKCGFCDRNAKPTFGIDHIKKEYSIIYNKGYSCGTIECKNNISIDILGIDYNPKIFEKIGSRKEYLSKLYKIGIEDAKKLKYSETGNHFDNSLKSFIELYGEDDGKRRHDKRINGIKINSARNKFPCTLDNFIKRYGNELGTCKYKDRCKKISYTSSKDYFIKKYGEEKANEIWKNKYKTIRTSKKSKIISNILDGLNIEYVMEKMIKGKFVDYFLPKYNMVIEYYGDYWHCNPNKFNKEYYMSQLKMEAKEVWEKDKKRIDLIKTEVNSILIIWESTNINDSLTEKYINDFKNKKIIVYL